MDDVQQWLIGKGFEEECELFKGTYEIKKKQNTAL